MKTETIGDCVLYCADSMETIDLIEADCMVTDPPYGVNLGAVKNGQAKRKNQQKYDCFDDTPEYIKNTIVPIVKKCVDKFDCSVITPGNRNMYLYPQPVDMGAWWNPAGTSRGKWGFQLMVTPLFYYGLDPYRGKGSRPSSPHNVGASTEGKRVNHPCPKPLSIMRWLVDRVSMCQQTVFDPFMGSGTTGVACVEMGRKFIGCDISEKYFSETCRRIEQAYSQPDMFYKQAKPEQAKLL